MCEFPARAGPCCFYPRREDIPSARTTCPAPEADCPESSPVRLDPDLAAPEGGCCPAPESYPIGNCGPRSPLPGALTTPAVGCPPGGEPGPEYPHGPIVPEIVTTAGSAVATPSGEIPDGGYEVWREQSPPAEECNVAVETKGTGFLGVGKQRTLSEYRVVSGCPRLPLKRGSMDMRWVLRSGTGPALSGIGPDDWLPAGRGGMFAFLPYVNENIDNGTWVSLPSGKHAKYDSGTLGPQNHTESYFYFDAGIGRFVDYYPWSRTYFEYSEDGRLRRVTDRDGNALDYHYTNNAVGNPILRSIGGSALGRLVPYFEYADESTAVSPIATIALRDKLDGTQDRITYLEYASLTLPLEAYLTKITSPEGCVTRVGLDNIASNNYYTAPVSETDPDNFTTYYEHNDQWIRQTIEPEGRVTYLDYGTAVGSTETFVKRADRADLTQHTLTYYEYAMGSVSQYPGVEKEKTGRGERTFERAADDRTIGRTDRGGVTTYYTYEAGKQIASIVRGGPSGPIDSSSYAYDGDWVDLLVREGPRSDQVVYYQYDGRGHVTARTDPRGASTYYEYDGTGQRIAQTDADGNTTYYTHDAYGNRGSRLDPGGAVTYYRHGPGRKVTVWEDPEGRVTYYAYDLQDRLTKRIDALGGEWESGYNARGLKTVSIDPRGEVTYWEYDGRKRMTSRKGLVGSGEEEETRSYDVWDNLRTRTDPRGNTQYFIYQAEGHRELARTDALGNATYYEYDPVGVRTRSTDARGNAYEFGYDEAHRHAVTTDPLGGPRYFEYDPAGNRTVSIDARTNPAYFEHDPLGRETRRTDALGNATSVGHDPDGDRRVRVDARGNPTYFEHDAMHNPKSQTDALGNTAYFEHDRVGNRTRALDARGNASTFGYDGLDRRSVATDALGNSAYFEHDPIGNRTKAIDALGAETTFGYDARSRLIRQTDDVGSTAYFEYDKNGNRTKSLDVRGNPTTFGYDKVNRRSAVTDALTNAVYFEHDEVGNRIKTTDARGNATTFGYDPLDRQNVATDALANNTYFEHDPNGNRTKTLDARGSETTFGYDKVDRRNVATDALSNSVYFEHDPNGNQSRTIDARGGATDFAYDKLNRQIAVTDSLLNATYFEHDAVGSQTKTTDARGNAATFGYDAVNRRNVVTDALGESTYFEHDAVGRQTAVLDALGQSSRGFYDSLGRLVASKDVSGDRTYFEYDKAGSQTRVLDANLHDTLFAYDVLNRREGVTDAAGGKTYFEYDENGNRTKVTDPRANAATSQYDAVNRLIATTNAESETTYFAHDAVGNQTSVLDPNAHETLFGYDKLNRLEVTTDAETAKTYFEYDANGNRTKVTDARTHATVFDYDLLNRLNVTTDPLGGNTYFAHDAVGNQTSVIDPNANETQFAYDKLNRLQTTIDAESGKTYFEYDPLGNQTRVIDPNAHATGFQYAENRLEQTEDAEGRKTVFGYDPVGNKLLEATVVSGTAGYGAQSYGNTPYGGAAPAGYHPTYFEYDPLNRLAKTVDGIGNAQLFGYDPNSNLDAMTDGDGETTYYAYDKVNRLTRKTFANDPEQTFSHDPAGNILTALDARGTSYFEYDNVNRLLVETDPTGESVYFQWDGVGNRTAVTYPGTIGTAYYEYDANNRMAVATAPSGRHTYYEYDAGGNETKRTLGNGVYAVRTYDAVNRIASLSWYKSDGTPIVTFTIDRDAAGRIVSIGREGAVQIDYGYDRGNWLTAEERDGALSYQNYFEYDPAGNRTQLLDNGTDTDSFYDRANQLNRKETGADKTYYEYDGNGSTTRIAHPDGTNTYFEYDDQRRVNRAAFAGQQGMEMHYNALGDLYALRDETGTLTYFRWDPTRRLNLLVESDASLTPTAIHTHGRSDIRGVGTLVETDRGGTPEFQVMDIRGSVHRLLDLTEAIVMEAEYKAYGDLIQHTGSSPRHLYQTPWLKLQPGNDANPYYHTRAGRIYNDEEGRFEGRDHETLNRVLRNKYASFNNLPTNITDPNGLLPSADAPDQPTPSTRPTERESTSPPGVDIDDLPILLVQMRLTEPEREAARQRAQTRALREMGITTQRQLNQLYSAMGLATRAVEEQVNRTAREHGFFDEEYRVELDRQERDHPTQRTSRLIHLFERPEGFILPPEEERVVRARNLRNWERWGDLTRAEKEAAFIEWAISERDNLGGWIGDLRDCPCCLPRGSRHWTNPNEVDAKYHPPPAHLEVRSESGTLLNAGQQCIYDRDGNLITHGLAAGTADRQRGVPLNVLDHRRADVIPFERAKELDGEGINGRFQSLYQAVRPINVGRDENGLPCPRNP